MFSFTSFFKTFFKTFFRVFFIVFFIVFFKFFYLKSFSSAVVIFVLFFAILRIFVIFEIFSSIANDNDFSRFVEKRYCIVIAVIVVVDYECKQYSKVVNKKVECEIDY